jgi:ABC-type lipoprotein release transport system permease subunit
MYENLQVRQISSTYAPKGAELTMNRDNISALVMAMTVVVSVIVGFTIYFNNPSLNQAWSVQQQQQQKDKGLVVVGGVHSPEFQLEKNLLHLTKKVYSVGDK